MITLEQVQLLLGLLTLFFAYIVTVSTAGFFRALVAKLMGDSTAESNGFLTLNPLMHIDPFGLLCLILFRHTNFTGFGWGRHVPINPLNIQGMFRWPKLIAAFFSDTVMHFALATLSVVLFSVTVGQRFTGMASLKNLTSSEQAMFQLLIAFVSLNVFLVLIEFVINCVILVRLALFKGEMHSASSMSYILMFAPLIIVFLFGAELQLMIYNCMRLVHCNVFGIFWF